MYKNGCFLNSCYKIVLATLPSPIESSAATNCSLLLLLLKLHSREKFVKGLAQLLQLHFQDFLHFGTSEENKPGWHNDRANVVAKPIEVEDNLHPKLCHKGVVVVGMQCGEVNAIL